MPPPAAIIRGIMSRKIAPLARLAPLAALLGFAAWLGAQEAKPEPARTATLLTLHDAIGPATSYYIERGLAVAAKNGSALVVIEMDTPGGLDTSMRAIIQAILASPVPVVTYVSPSGARAASAGTYILYASHVAAMAPATNLGAATPVPIGGSSSEEPDKPAPDGAAGAGDGETPTDNGKATPRAAPEPRDASGRKAVNDAVAYIRSLAEQRGRNADWAERAVRSGESLSAQAALDQQVIDVIASDLDDLLTKLDGRRAVVIGTERTLETTGLIYVRVDPNWRERLLSVISNPTVAYMLLLLGIYGLIFEGYNPGAVLPGVVGAIAMLLALYSLQLLPVNYAGLALILLGVILMIAEFLVPSFGSLGIGGVAAFVFGSVILIDADAPGFGISRPLIGTIGAAGAIVVLGVIWSAMRSRQLPVVSGAEQMTRLVATALEDFADEGAVKARGERWRARTSAPVRKGQQLHVIRVEGLVLDVEPFDQ